MKLFLVLFIFIAQFISSFVFAKGATYYTNPIKADAFPTPTSKKLFCETVAVTDLYGIELLKNEENHLAFVNSGGIGDNGVCWWHSLFTRNATYLAVYLPDLPKPNKREIKNIIRNIAKGTAVVEIPGYYNLYEFSKENKTELMKLFNNWQISDGGVGGGWIRGVFNPSKVTGDELKIMMDDFFIYFQKNPRVTYQKLQIPGIDSHAWLVLDIFKVKNGYDILVLDSNYTKTYIYHYIYGETALYYKSVPYTSRNDMNFLAYKKAAKEYCKTLSIDTEESF